MKNACWAAWWHFRSTDQTPHHCLCNPDRCGMYKDPKFTHEGHNLAATVCDAIHPAYGDLSRKQPRSSFGWRYH
ncbi:unnamed protein product [Didymodactylos carnosus]|uniref:Uncharacterized protein n=1 Tax=Didymodactylos carnosus TaxID=1234261 RepID=A0A8S2TBA3_9BILA|nr:unnamed protein product [Didymodactylos carnosus]CAF4272104.1 unnamed protein product [Didymodactylos carnosus]